MPVFKWNFKVQSLKKACIFSNARGFQFARSLKSGGHLLYKPDGLRG